eukprot:TRINITY_DN14806_c0_g1_i3.p1 TRINITY_DN14806_c0_g1~~TRINITY_DN14806_c0_g1_i3.p1  ORF type:complete len:251 (+),score=14.70 TRINITY_DN14806_c0_g1_i3:180-932(+)
MVDVLKQVDMTNILHRLLAEEREKIAEFIHASHMTLASHFEHDVALLCEGTGQNLLAPSADYSVAGSFLHGNFVNCGKVEAPLADAALPDTLALGNNSPNGETLNGTRVIAETLNGNHRNEQSAPEKAAPSDFHAHSGSGGLSHTVKRISNLQMTSVGKPNIRNGRSEATVGRLRRIVDSAMFELVFAFLIFLLPRALEAHDAICTRFIPSSVLRFRCCVECDWHTYSFSVCPNTCLSGMKLALVLQLSF